ncbi:hypothetical protein NDU88_000828 [Pleurodeles waltl]|uniref:Uncharacterized protein n=1 Tax=Pleurodeles waltl TaxID=8319 RepID=A0AAV7N918_PLEWA|nr:hypothetical protein NDU88_000828 [Pleurodeles waltl]
MRRSLSRLGPPRRHPTTHYSPPRLPRASPPGSKGGPLSGAFTSLAGSNSAPLPPPTACSRSSLQACSQGRARLPALPILNCAAARAARPPSFLHRSPAAGPQASPPFIRAVAMAPPSQLHLGETVSPATWSAGLSLPFCSRRRQQGAYSHLRGALRLPPLPPAPAGTTAHLRGAATVQLSWSSRTAPHHTRVAPVGRAHRSCKPADRIPEGRALRRRHFPPGGQHRAPPPLEPHRCPGPSTAGAAGLLSPVRLRISRAGRRAPLARVRHVRHRSHAP